MDSNCLGHYLKIWADHYPCTGEIKGSTIPLVHKILVVTSNFTIAELFKECEKLIEPIQRRF